MTELESLTSLLACQAHLLCELKPCLDKAEFSLGGLGRTRVCPAGLGVRRGDQMLEEVGGLTGPPPKERLEYRWAGDRATGRMTQRSFCSPLTSYSGAFLLRNPSKVCFGFCLIRSAKQGWRVNINTGARVSILIGRTWSPPH